MQLVKEYANAPVALVVFEVRHPVRRLPEELSLCVGEAVREFAPIPRTDNQTHLNPMTGEQRVLRRTRFTSRKRDLAVAVSDETITVETTTHSTWLDLRRVIAAVLEPLAAQDAPSTMDRIGLRYFDEIRIPGTSAPFWPDWIDAGLTGPRFPLPVDGFASSTQQGISVLANRSGNTMFALRYGAADGPPAVQSNEALIRSNQPADGPFFFIDIDGSWELGAQETAPEFTAAAILDLADQIHAPIRSLFEHLITDRLRNEVLQ